MSVQRICLFITLIALTGVAITAWHYYQMSLEPDPPLAKPGLTFRPTPTTKPQMNLIKYIKAKPETFAKYVQDLRNYHVNESVGIPMDPVNDTAVCNLDEPQIVNDSYCLFDINTMEYRLCSEENEYGYPEGKPCLALSLNNVIDWRPLDYKSAAEIPQKIAKDYVKGFITFTCEPNSGMDKEHLGRITFFPTNKISFKYFPGVENPGYVSPFIWAKFENPATGVLLNITCKAWTADIDHNADPHPEGIFSLLLLVDETTQSRRKIPA